LHIINQHILIQEVKEALDTVKQQVTSSKAVMVTVQFVGFQTENVSMAAETFTQYADEAVIVSDWSTSPLQTALGNMSDEQVSFVDKNLQIKQKSFTHYSYAYELRLAVKPRFSHDGYFTLK